MISRATELLNCYFDVRGFNGTPQDAVQFSLQQPIRPLQVQSEITELTQMVVDLKPKRVLEIGTAAGGTLFIWCQSAQPDATIVSVDLPHGVHGGGYHWAKIPLYKSFARENQSLHLLRADSHADSTVERVKGLFSEPIDYLFIDGDHTYQGVRKDFEMYSPLVRSGGLIALHDIVPHDIESGCEVHRFWQEIKANYETTEIVADWGQKFAGIGLVHV